MLTPCQLKILEFVWECPLSEPLENCPFNELRKKSLNDQVRVVQQLTEQEEEDLFQYHFACKHYRFAGDMKSINKLEIPNVFNKSILHNDSLYKNLFFIYNP
jgi:hypothetical protein